MAVWITDLIVVILLMVYVLTIEKREGAKWKEGGWWDQGGQDWTRQLKLSGSCCLTTCLEWWCIEILVLLTGRLADAKQAVGVLAIVLNFDYLLYSVMLSLATCASIQVSNLLGANQGGPAYQSAYVSLAASIAQGCIGGSVMVAARGLWGTIFSHGRDYQRCNEYDVVNGFGRSGKFPVVSVWKNSPSHRQAVVGHVRQPRRILLAGLAFGSSFSFLCPSRIEWTTGRLLA